MQNAAAWHSNSTAGFHFSEPGMGGILDFHQSGCCQTIIARIKYITPFDSDDAGLLVTGSVAREQSKTLFDEALIFAATGPQTRQLII